MAGHGGGSWKVAYADFVTAMMAFFMVMWITSQGEDTKEAISHYFQDPFGKSGESNGPVSGLPGGGPTMHRQGEQGKRPGVRVIPSDKSGLGTTIHFASSSAALDDTAKRHLSSLAPELSGMPQRIEIRGHASRTPLAADSGFADPWSLSYARCQAAMQFLVDQGVEAERIRLSQSGPFQPATNAESAELQLQNERVEVFVLREFVPPASGIEKRTGNTVRPVESDADQRAESQEHGDVKATPASRARDDHASMPQASPALAFGGDALP